MFRARLQGAAHQSTRSGAEQDEVFPVITQDIWDPPRWRYRLTERPQGATPNTFLDGAEASSRQRILRAKGVSICCDNPLKIPAESPHSNR